MGDNMKKVRSGDPLDIPAATFNTFIDASRDFLDRQNNRNRRNATDSRNSGIILIKNGSGEDRARFEILGIKEPIISVSDNEEQFKNRVALTGELPTEDDHTGKFVILLEPLKNNGLGLAMALGVCPVKLTLDSEDHTHADVKDSDSTTLQSGFFGAAEILWKEDGTGEKWAVVRISTGKIRNIHADDATNAYEIDRTSEDDDDKEWNPSNDQPSDWGDYDCVKLTVEYLRYVAGDDSTDGSLKRVKQEFHWAAANAPVIPAADVEDAETGVCDE